MKLRKLLSLTFAFIAIAASADNRGLQYNVNPATGAINSITISGDTTQMEWLLRTDGQQYKWVTDSYGWGLGYMSVNGQKLSWKTPVKSSKDFTRVSYIAGGIRIDVNRKMKDGCFVESYNFVNTSKTDIKLTDIGIYTPFNDNYPDAEVCMQGRCNAHIWTGGNAAYIEAVRMRGLGDGIGLMVTDGSITDYDIWERSKDKGMSNYRGIIAFCPQDTVIKRGKSMAVAWKVFTHSNHKDFVAKIISNGGAVLNSDKYVYELGETANIEMTTAKGTTVKSIKVTATGEQTVRMNYGNNKSTFAKIYGVNSYNELMGKRANFIIDHQQMNDTADARYGAYMVYDNDENKIYLNDNGRKSSDTDEGRERVGMGVFLAKWYALHPNDKLKESLVRYASFIRNKLQRDDFTTFSNVNKTGKIRGYNYPWIADFYFHMYDITGDKKYADYGYGTMKAFFRRFGYGFYAIDIPVIEGLKVLKNANMTAERDSLMEYYTLTADKFIKNGLNFPHHEVNYEQSIVAPAVQFLSEMYLATGEQRYKDCATMIMPALESFAGNQPAYNMNEISIRHWDGYWFGKRQMLGDVFPHYWSTLNASAYYYYGKCTGNATWQHRAENIVRNNLCQFFEDGKASCALVNPRMINGEKAHYSDAFANDQDWALVFYLLVNKGL